MIRLVALDVDGTLLNSASKLTDANLEAVRRAVEKGVQVLLATSRWYLLAKRTAGRLGISTPLICNNGALVKLQTDTEEELLHLRLDHDLARQVTALGDERGWDMFTTFDDLTYMRPREGIIPERLPAGLTVAERQSEHAARARPTAVLVFGEDAMAEIGGRFLPACESRARFSFNRSQNYPPYVVLTHRGADKGKALIIACTQLGIAPGEALAVGDSESDVSMFRVAGLGVAMGNASDAVKAEAAAVAPSNDEDGVAWAIEKFVL
ncbi:MAG: Cof-type HAD-IIB family hydrolase [Chloroflexi bacterium]|nr:Cof-type HAD-IIB family hydrolase [Chloroflexota bacterium]